MCADWETRCSYLWKPIAYNVSLNRRQIILDTKLCYIHIIPMGLQTSKHAAMSPELRLKSLLPSSVEAQKEWEPGRATSVAKFSDKTH